MVARGDTATLLRSSTDGAEWTPWDPVLGNDAGDPTLLVPGPRPILITSLDEQERAWQLDAQGRPSEIDATALAGADTASMAVVSVDGARSYVLLPAADGPRLRLRSPDGTWSTVALPADVGRSLLAVADDGIRLVIVALDEGPNRSTYRAWLGASPALAT